MVRSEGLWLDSDVLLDWLCDRQPWNVHAETLLSRAIDGNWQVFTSPLALANVFYIHRKHAGSAAALNALKLLTEFIQIATLDGAHVRKALATDHPDFEDQLQIACAAGVPELSAIITRNLSDYSNASVPAMSAEQWLAARHPP